MVTKHCRYLLKRGRYSGCCSENGQYHYHQNIGFGGVRASDTWWRGRSKHDIQRDVTYLGTQAATQEPVSGRSPEDA